MYKKLSHEEHLELSAKLLPLVKELNEVRRIIHKNYEKKHAVSQSIHRICSTLDTLREKLENEYNAVTTDEQYDKHGFIYYNKRRQLK
jgi:hypothetical protein